jgi:hypothetical protein
MIEIIDDMIRTAKKVTHTVYRSYPAKNITAPAIVINPSGRNVLMTDEEGNEVVTQLSYTVDFLSKTQRGIDEMFRKLTKLYNRKNIHSTSYSPMYILTADVYGAVATYTVTVDRRGMTYRS